MTDESCVTPVVEFLDDGRFRIRKGEVVGEAAGYHGIASLTARDHFSTKTYIAVTDYHDGGPLKPETVYEIKEVSL